MKDYIKCCKAFLKDTIFPVRCPYCEKVIARDECACNICKAQFPGEPVKRYAVGGYECIAPFPYDRIFETAAKAFKFCNRGGYAKQLAKVISESIIKAQTSDDFDIITCVPMHRKRQRQRGYNQARLLAVECAEILNIPYADTLEKYKENLEQHSIKASLRADNVRGVYRIIDSSLVENKRVLIIDDIITTGNTLGECARILMKSGCKSVSCAVLCAVTSN